jgi:hypothetical protein
MERNRIKETPTQPVINRVNYSPAIIELRCEKEIITAQLDDGRNISIPTAWFPHLRKATIEQLNKFQIAFDGADITWPELDTDISVKSFTHGLNSACC